MEPHKLDDRYGSRPLAVLTGRDGEREVDTDPEDPTSRRDFILFKSLRLGNEYAEADVEDEAVVEKDEVRERLADATVSSS